MKTKNFFIYFLLGILLCLPLQSKAQVTIGSEDEPNADAVLELKSTAKGLLLPRVALSATNLPSPLKNHVTGMMVYNTASAGTFGVNVSPGVYHNDGTQWVAVNDIEVIIPTVTVFVNNDDPNSASVFSESSPVDEDGNPNPNFVHDATLTKNPDYLYVAPNGDSWIWDGKKYITYVRPDVTPFYLSGSRLDAEGDKVSGIWRPGPIGIGGAAYPGTSITAYNHTYTEERAIAGRFSVRSLGLPENSTVNTKAIEAYSLIKNNKSVTGGQVALYAHIDHSIENNAAYVGNSAAISAWSTRGGGPSDNGNIENISTLQLMYGHRATTGTTNNIYGLWMYPYVRDGEGTVNNMYDIYVTGNKGSMISGTYYGLFINGGDKLNFIHGNLALGQTNPGTYKLYVRGNAYVTGTLTQNSDLRLKSDIINTPLGLDAVMKLRPVEYTYNSPEQKDEEGKVVAPSTSEKSIGFIAQEVEKIVPLAVSAPESEEEYYGLKYSALIPVLTKAIQEQQEYIKALEERIQALESK